MFYTISRCKPVFLTMIFLTLFMVMPVDQVLAAIIATENSASGREIRLRLLSALARDEIRSALLQRGIEPSEAESRINALTEDELLFIATKASSLISGGNRNVSKDQKEYNREYTDYILIPLLVLFVLSITMLGIQWLYDHYIRPQVAVRRYHTPNAEASPQTGRTEPSVAIEGNAQ